MRTNDAEELNKTLREWSSGAVELWEYTTSHGHLEIRLTSKARRGNLHLVCESCRSINGPVAWSSSALRVVDRGKRDDGRFEVSDSESGFKVICDLVGANTDVEPIY